MKAFLIPTLIGMVLGAFGGMAAIQGRGLVDLGSVSYEGWTGILVVMGIMGGVGMVIGLMVWLLSRALKTAASIQNDK
jgi:hypothetical protein